jgi:hypothetical protein
MGIASHQIRALDLIIDRSYKGRERIKIARNVMPKLKSVDFAKPLAGCGRVGFGS